MAVLLHISVNIVTIFCCVTIATSFDTLFLDRYLNKQYFKVTRVISTNFNDDLLQKCVESTRYSYWKCNQEDVDGMLQDPVNYRFHDREKFPHDIPAATTPEGAYVFALFGALFVKTAHMQCVMDYDLVCTFGCSGTYVSCPMYLKNLLSKQMR